MNRSLDRRLIIAFLPALAVAILAIIFCYNLLFATIYPSFHFSLILLCALLGGLIFYVLLVMSARTGGGRDETGKRSILRWVRIIVSFALLYLCSGYGFSSAYMLLYEGPAILRDHITTALGAYAQLQTVAERDLPIREYDEMARRVRSSQSGLLREILNPSGQNYCGVGPNAKRYISEIARDLSGFSVLAGTANVHDCRDSALIKRIAEAYVQDIDERLANHPIMAQRNVAPRLRLLGDIRERTAHYNNALGYEAGRLSAVANLVFNYSMFGKTSALLQQASADYLTLHQSLKSLNGGSAAQIPATIDVSMLHKLVSGFEIPMVLWDRLNRLVTWVALLLPLVIDFLFVRYSRAVLGHYRYLATVAASARIAPTEVVYLWRPHGEQD